ncbi:CubicO group peptidase (beta-lactamase class C family) [Actinoplanes campanulatus]|uniref:CubicO group peptidase (Beta-lactamase class C family) n=1 Tax=Actinoplanes campanulatus TaxID=113559 RepID=A0A7W5FJG5_9ACTN|nr:serine hydrolase domain-containing protein [Actinoplanes campanulatus]MBB3100734.1 CubicO group peptidase (beta-lactamase class C family) [Actinoplanes campanulatus]GGN46068.1 FmtA-like protein [Actinoplanes campanulatus]GID41204.1 FmtA-like protein [Actinoplanes campanulatus]
MRALTRRTLISLFLGCVAVPAVAPARPAVAVPVACPTATPAALAGFFDGALPIRLTAARVPGAAVSVAAGGATAFAKGYGMADTERAVPFDASRSLVRIASISKLFTWTAVMQQVEVGRLDLDADVNRYLAGFQVPGTYDQPVTLRHLMSHTAGFEDVITGTGARDAAGVPPLGRYLADHMPARIRPPGEVSAYSNYGAALAGHIVSEVSGERYDQYIQRHLLDPLGMARSTAAEPVPAALAPDLARSYDTDLTPPKVYPFTFDRMPPDGSITTTAADMAGFMNAHLHEGRFGAGRILSPQTTARMHQRSFTADPRVDGYAHGFKERTVNGHRVLLHDGGWEGFTSIMMLVPDCDLGLFLTMNSLSGGNPDLQRLVDDFFDRFAPEGGAAGGEQAARATVGAARPAEPRAGFYKPARHNATSFEKFTTLLSPSRLAIDDAGVLTFRQKTWTRQGDGRYQAADGDRLVFLVGTDGRHYVATDGSAAELMSRAETLPVNLGVLLVFLLPVLGVPALLIGRLVRRIRRRPAGTTPTWRLARRLAVAAAVLGVVFLGGLIVTVLTRSGEFLYGVPLSFRLLRGVPVVALTAAVAATGLTVKGWRGSGAGVAARVHQAALLTAMVALTWFLWQWNLLGW